MEDRPGMGGATGEIRQREDPEHGRFQRLPERHVRPAAAGGEWRLAPGGAALGGGCRAKQQRGRQDNGPGDEAEREHGEAPVMGDDQPARERRHQRRAQRQTGRDKGNGEAAMAHKPTGGGGGQRDIDRAGGEPGGGAVNSQKHRKTLRLARHDEAKALQEPAEQHDHARTVSVE